MNVKNNLSIQLFSLLSTAGISYAVLRNYKTLPDSLGGSDLDIWVASSDIGKFTQILNLFMQKEEAFLVSYIADKRCPKVCLTNTDNGIQADIFRGCIPYRNSVLVDERIIQKHIVTYNGIRVLDDNFAKIIAYVKEIMNNGYSTEKYSIPVYQSAYTFTEEYVCTNFPNFSDGCVRLLAQAIKNRTLTEDEKRIVRLGRMSLMQRSSFGSRIKKFSRLLRKPGYVIAVLGTDGSGKSTIIDAITPWLDESFHHGVEYRHLRPGVLPDLGVLLGKKEPPKKGETPKVVTDPHALRPSGFCGSLLRWGYYLLDYTFGYWKSIWPRVATKSKVFIFDRYYYDNYVDQRRARTSLPKWILRLGDCVVPSPDLILCLGGDPQKVYQRKPETSLEEVARQTRELKQFCSERKCAVWVDTTLPKEESVRNAKEEILKMMSVRFKDVMF